MCCPQDARDIVGGCRLLGIVWSRWIHSALRPEGRHVIFIVSAGFSPRALNRVRTGKPSATKSPARHIWRRAPRWGLLLRMPNHRRHSAPYLRPSSHGSMRDGRPKATVLRVGNSQRYAGQAKTAPGRRGGLLPFDYAEGECVDLFDTTVRRDAGEPQDVVSRHYEGGREFGDYFPDARVGLQPVEKSSRLSLRTIQSDAISRVLVRVQRKDQTHTVFARGNLERIPAAREPVTLHETADGSNNSVLARRPPAVNAPGNQDSRIRQERRRMERTRRSKRICGCPCARNRIVKLQAGKVTTPRDASRHEHSSVGQECRGVHVARKDHRTRGRPGIGRRIIQLGTGDRRGAV